MINKTKEEKKDLLYIAGGLFSEAERRQRNYEKQALTERFGDSLEIFSPLTGNPSNDKSSLPTAQDIFLIDTKKIMNSKYIFAELDGEDAGVMAELGIAFGVNLILERLVHHVHEAVDDSDFVNRICDMIEDFPRKKIVSHLSDIRFPNAGDYEDYYVPVGINQYVIGLIELMGSIHPSTDIAMNEIQELIGIQN